MAIGVNISTSAIALEGQNGPYSYSVKKNGDLCITKFDWRAYGEEDVYIPKMIDGYTVTQIGDYAFSNAELAEENRSVYGTNAVVIIPNTVSQIGEKAFFCTHITALNIPESVKEIGYGAFSGCDNLSSISIDKANPNYAVIDGVLYNKSQKELIAFPAGLSANITIPEGIKSIAPFAFYNTMPYNVELPSTLETIGDHAFEYSRFKNIVQAGTSPEFSNIVLLGYNAAPVLQLAEAVGK